MPSIDPRRLRREAARAAQAADDPSEALSRAVRLLEFHADRTRRPASAARAEDALPGFGAPGPVRRALEAAFDKALDSHGPRWDVIDTFWNSGYQEVQGIAAALMGSVAEAVVAERVEQLALDPGTTRSARRLLAGRGLRAWRRSDPPAFLDKAQHWVRSDEAALVALGLEALSAGLDAIPSERTRECFAALSGLAGEMEATQYRGYVALLGRLFTRSQAEGAQFLLDELRRHNYHPAYRGLVRELAEGFSEPQRTRLKTALAAAGQ